MNFAAPLHRLNTHCFYSALWKAFSISKWFY